jgi:antitoxin YefM
LQLIEVGGGHGEPRLDSSKEKSPSLPLRFGYDLTKRTFLRTMPPRSQIMTTLTASEARSSLYRLIDQAAESHKPIMISGKRANAVLVSEEDWSAIQETLHLLAIPNMRESIKDAMAEPLTKSKKALKW